MIAEQTAFAARVTVWSSPARGARRGGDWCEVLALSEDVIVLTVGDVSGHGEAAAATMTEIRAAVLEAAAAKSIPSQILAIVNEDACAHGDGVIVTTIVAIVDQRASTLTFANAGHPPPLMMIPEGPVFLQRLPANLPLGIYRDYRVEDYVVALPPDSLVMLYTDGLTEHERDVVEGERELIEAARLVHRRTELNDARAVARRVLGHRRGGDDAAAIGLRIAPRDGRSADDRVA